MIIILLLLLTYFVKIINIILELPPGFPPYPDDVLAGGDRQTHHTGAVYRHDSVADAQLTTALSRTSMKEICHDNCGQDGAPARLYYGQTQDLSWCLGDDNLNARHTAF